MTGIVNYIIYFFFLKKKQHFLALQGMIMPIMLSYTGELYAAVQCSYGVFPSTSTEDNLLPWTRSSSLKPVLVRLTSY